MKILVIDVGGTHVKCDTSDQQGPAQFRSGPRLTPGEMVRQVLRLSGEWTYEAISIGYPGVVRAGAPAVEPHNLGPGWVGFDFAAALGRPVRMLNDAAMQALGAYRGGKMLFLGLGTGLGSALIVEQVVLPLELGHLRRTKRHDYEHFLGDAGRKRLGEERWAEKVRDTIEEFRRALLPEEIVLGGGNASRLEPLPPETRRGGNADAFAGGVRLWERPQSGATTLPVATARSRSGRSLAGRRAR